MEFALLIRVRWLQKANIKGFVIVLHIRRKCEWKNILTKLFKEHHIQEESHVQAQNARTPCNRKNISVEPTGYPTRFRFWWKNSPISNPFFSAQGFREYKLKNRTCRAKKRVDAGKSYFIKGGKFYSNFFCGPVLKQSNHEKKALIRTFWCSNHSCYSWNLNIIKMQLKELISRDLIVEDRTPPEQN